MGKETGLRAKGEALDLPPGKNKQTRVLLLEAASKPGRVHVRWTLCKDGITGAWLLRWLFLRLLRILRECSTIRSPPANFFFFFFGSGD